MPLVGAMGVRFFGTRFVLGGRDDEGWKPGRVWLESAEVQSEDRRAIAVGFPRIGRLSGLAGVVSASGTRHACDRIKSEGPADVLCCE